MKKIIFNLIIGLILLISGLIVLNFAGHKHMTKGFIMTFIGFILSGSSGLTLYKSRKHLSKKESMKDVIDQQQHTL